jgi:hypothetical protein
MGTDYYNLPYINFKFKMTTIERIILPTYNAYFDKNKSIHPKKVGVDEQKEDEKKVNAQPRRPLRSATHIDPFISDLANRIDAKIIADNDDDSDNNDDDSDNNDSAADNDDTEDLSAVTDMPQQKPLDEEKFWRIIGTLGWRNADEQKFTSRDIKRNLSAEDLFYLKSHIGTLASHVEASVRPLGWFSNSTEQEIKNFTYHVVALGHQQYLVTSFDPGFTQFIWDAHPKIYQDLYDMLNAV